MSTPYLTLMLPYSTGLNDNRYLCCHDFARTISITTILFTGILIAVPFSALTQQQPLNITTVTMLQQQLLQSPQSDSMMYEEDNKALVRSFVEEVFNEHNMSAVDKYYMHKILYNCRAHDCPR